MVRTTTKGWLIPDSIEIKFSFPSNAVQCYVPAWMGGEFGGEWTHEYVWLSPFAIHLKLSLLTGYTNTK